MEEYLLDSNILIYFSQGHLKIKKFLSAFKREYFFISTISSIEVLIGARNKTELKDLKDLLHQFVPLDLRTEIAHRAVQMEHEYPKKLKFKDLLIAATAQLEGLTLITADKDFQKLKGLKVHFLKI